MFPSLQVRLTEELFTVVFAAKPPRECFSVNAGENLKALTASLNIMMVSLSISRSRFLIKQCQIPQLNVFRFCVNFWVSFGHFGKEIFQFLKGC